jgi:hypothetical protein
MDTTRVADRHTFPVAVRVPEGVGQHLPFLAWPHDFKEQRAVFVGTNPKEKIVRTRILALVSLAFAAVGITAVGTPAQAAEEKPSHCIVNVTTPIAKVECFDSFTVAVAKATDGRVTDAPRDAEKAATDKGFEAKLRALSKLAAQPGVRAQNVIEIDYDYGFWGTSTFTWWVESNSCWGNPLGTVRWQVWNLDDYGWNDRINGFANHNFCRSTHFEHAGFQGLAIGWSTAGGLGPLDGEVSSIQWS